MANKKKSSSKNSKSKKSPQPSDPALYAKVKSSIKAKAKKSPKLTWPSVVTSSMLVKEYKKAYKKKHPRGSPYKGKKSKNSGLTRWYDEKWIDVCKLPKKVSCKRPTKNMSMKKWKSSYPYCRPSKRVNSSTPKTANELTKAQIKSRCSRKKKNPKKKIKN